MQKKAREIHALAEHSREDGQFLDALKFTDEATVQYVSEGDRLGLAEIQGSRFLTLRHLWEQTNNEDYLILAKHAAMSAAELADKSGNAAALALPYFNLAKAYETLGELSEAVVAYKKAVQAQTDTPDEHHARPAVLNDMKVHLAVCEYKNGRKEALSDAEKALTLLEEDKAEGDYTRDVWSSGSHMKIAEALKSDQPEKAKEHLQKAKQIIDANPDLTLRKGQWEKLSASFN